MMKNKTRRNRLVSILLAGCMLASMLPGIAIDAAAASTETALDDVTLTAESTSSTNRTVSGVGNKVLTFTADITDPSTTLKANIKMYQGSSTDRVEVLRFKLDKGKIKLSDLSTTDSTTNYTTMGSYVDGGTYSFRLEIIPAEGDTAATARLYLVDGETKTQLGDDFVLTTGCTVEELTRLSFAVDSNSGEDASVAFTNMTYATGVDLSSGDTGDDTGGDSPNEANVVFSQDFEGDVVYASASTGTTQVIDLNGNKVLEMVDNDTGSTVAKANFKFTDAEGNMAPQSGQITISYKMYVVADVEGEAVDTVLDFACGSKENAGGWCTAKVRQILLLKTSAANKQLQFQGRGESTSTKSATNAYAIGGWTEVKLVLDTDTGSFEVFANGMSQGTATLCYTSDSSATALDKIDNIAFFTESSAKAHVYIDDIVVSVPASSEEGGGTGDGGGDDTPPVTKTPADTGCIDFSGDGWKLQLPVEDPDKSGSILEKSPTELAGGYYDEYFYADTDDNGDDAVVFHTPVAGAKTENTSYTRSELREMLDPGDKTVNWSWEGTHTLTTVQRVTHVPASGQTITSQVHAITADGENAPPLVKVRYMYDAAANTGTVRVELKKDAAGTTDEKHDFEGVLLGQKYTTTIQVEDGVAGVTVSTEDDGGTRSETYTLDFVSGDEGWESLCYYFKLGNYIQDNTDTSENAYADVWTYSAAIAHTDPAALPAAVTVSGASDKHDYTEGVSGEGIKTLAFTVDVPDDGSTVKTGIQFKGPVGSSDEVLRFKVDNGKFLISDHKTDSGSYEYETLGTYTAGTSYSLKLWLIPADGETAAKVRLCQVSGTRETQLGEDYTLTNGATLASFSHIIFFSDSSNAATVKFTGVAFADNQQLPAEDTSAATEYWATNQEKAASLPDFTTTGDEIMATLPCGVTMAVGAGTWKVGYPSKSLTLGGATYTQYIACLSSSEATAAGVSSNSLNLTGQKGEYFKFVIPADIDAGELTVALRVNSGKTLHVLEMETGGDVGSAAEMSGYGDEYSAPQVNTDLAEKLSVEGGHTYIVYVESSLPYFYGFSFRPVDMEADIARFRAELEALGFDWIKNENASADAVYTDLLLDTSYQSAFGACDVTWSSNSMAVSGGGTVNRLAEDTEVTLTANISVQQISYLNLYIPFTVTVKALTDDTEAVDGALEALTLGNTSAVRRDLTLPSAGMHGTTVTWESSDSAVLTVDAENELGVIHPNDSATQNVTLTATVSRGEVSKTKTFDVTVDIVALLDVNAWAYETADGDAYFVPVDGGKLHAINVTNNNQHLDTDDYRFKVEVLTADGTVKASGDEYTASAFFTHGVGVSEHIELDLPMDSTDTFRVTAYNDATTLVTFTHGADGDTVTPGAKLYVIGDSTAAAYADTKFPQKGWAQVLEQFFDGVEVVDLALPGRSSLDFKTKDNYQTLVNSIGPGDYLIIQFGHNDSHTADPTIYTDPSLDRFTDGDSPSYKKNMAEYVALAWEKGAHPIIATSISRRKLNDTTGQLYADAARALAEELSVPLLDVLDLSNGWINEVGLDEAKDMFLIVKAQDSRFYDDEAFQLAGNEFYAGNESSPDDTHVNINGATLIAMMAADGMVDLGLPLGACRNGTAISRRLPHYADAISGQAEAETLPPLPDAVTVTFNGDGVASKQYAVSAEGNQILTFTVTPSVTAGVSAGVRFLTGGLRDTKVEVLRFLLKDGQLKLGEAARDVVSQYTVLGSCAAGETYKLKLVLVPAEGDQPAFVKVYRLEDASGGQAALSAEGQESETLLGQLVLTAADLEGITALDFFADSSSAGSMEYTNIDYQTNVTLSEEEGSQPVVLPELPDALTVTAPGAGSTSGVSNKFAVDGTGNQILTFTVTPSVTGETRLYGGVKFYSDAAAENEVLRFKLESAANAGTGSFKLSDLRQNDSGKTAYATLGSYTPGEAYTVKLVIVPGADGADTVVRVYLVDGQAETQLGEDYVVTNSQLDAIAALDFFADSDSAGTFLYTDISYEGGADLGGGDDDPDEGGDAFTQDFEGDVVYGGDSQNHTGAEVIAEEDGNGNHVLKIVDTDTASDSTPSRANFQFGPMNGEITITYNMKVLTDDSVLAMLVGSKTNTSKWCTSSAGEFLRVKITGTSKSFEFRGGSSSKTPAQKAGSYTVGTWIAMKVVIDTESGRVDVYADGTLLGTTSMSNSGDAVALTDLDNIAFMSEKAGVAQVYIDDLSITAQEAEGGGDEPVGPTPADTLPESLTVTAGTDAVTNKYPVSGTGNQVLTFAVTPSATTGLGGGVKFYSTVDGKTAEVLRFKLDLGSFKLGGADGNLSSYRTIGTYAAGETYQVKVVIVPATEDQNAFVKVYLVDGETETQLGDPYTVTANTLAQITQLDFFADSGRSGVYTYTGIAFQADAELSDAENEPPEPIPEDPEAADSPNLLRRPSTWSDPSAITNETLTVAAGATRAAYTVPVYGDGVKTLTFTVSLTADNVKQVKGGVNFRNDKGTVLRLKLQNGRFRLSDLVETDEKGNAVYTYTTGTFTKDETFSLKVELYPATEQSPAYVKLYKNNVFCQSAYLLDRAGSDTLESITRLEFFTDADEATLGTVFAYRDMVYTTGPKTPAQTDVLDFAAAGWTLHLANNQTVGAEALAQGYYSENFYAATDGDGADVIALRGGELWEPIDTAGSANQTWSGTHTLTAELAAPQAPGEGQVLLARLQGADRDGNDAAVPVEIAYAYSDADQTGQIVVTMAKPGEDGMEREEYTLDDVPLGQRVQITVQMTRSVALAIVSDGTRSQTFTASLSGADSQWSELLYYFKLGDADADATDVWVYGATASHKASSSSGSSNERPNTNTNSFSDGSSTVTETWANGDTVITQTAANGDTMRTEQNADGTVQVTVTAQNGNASITVDAEGNTEGTVALSDTAVSRAERTGEVLTLPMPQLTPGRNADSAPVVSIAKAAGGPILVKLPAKQPGQGTVPLIQTADGGWEIIRMSVVTDDGVLFRMSDSMTVKLVDNAKDFSDVSADYWASDMVDFASGRELLVGTGDNRFSPDGATSRATLVTVLARLDGADTSSGDTWYAGGMDWAVARGISDGTDPDGLISREQFVTMLYRYAGEPAASESALAAFADRAAVSDWARAAMAWAVENGVMKGRAGGGLEPAGTATRAEAATLLLRYCMWNLGVELETAAPETDETVTVAFEQDFDALQPGYTWVSGAQVADLDGQRAVEITDTDTSGNTPLNYRFSAQSGTVTITFKLYIDPEAPDSALVMAAGSFGQTGRYSSNSKGEFFRVKTTGESRKFQFRGGDSTKTPSVSAGAYRVGEWIDMKVVADTDTQMFAVYANGELLGDNQPVSSKGGVAMNKIDNITFMTEKAGLAHVYVDDVKVTGQIRQFSIWDESLDDRVSAVGVAGDDLLSGAAQWQLKQGEIADGTLTVTGGEDSASNKVAVSGTGNKELCFTVVSDDEAGAKGGVRFVSQGEEALRFKLDGGKLKLTDMRTDGSGKVVYETLGTYSADTAYEIRLLLLDATADQAARVKTYVNGQQAGSAYLLSDTAAAALTEVTQLNFFTDKNTAGTLTYSDMTYRTGVAVEEDASASGGETQPSGDTPAGTGCIDFLKDGWKLQLPVENPAKAGSVLEISPEELAAGYADEFFYAAVDENGTPAVVFHSPVEGFKTGNTSYARSELRELIDPSNSKVNWTWQGTHTLTTEEAVTHVPASGATITAQIHGIEQNGDNANPLVKIRYMYDFANQTGKVRVELKDTTASTSYDYKYDFPNVALGQKYKTEIQVFDGVACVTISTTDPDGTQRSETYRHDFVAADPYWKETWYYFKLGDYIQDSTDTSDNAYADVWVYSAAITHSDTVDKVPVSDIAMDQSDLSIRSGERTGLSVTANPVKAYDKSVAWAVTEGTDVVAVDRDGYVTGLKGGVATVTATSADNPAATASVTVTVRDDAVVEVKPVFAVDFGAGEAGTDPAGYGGTGCAITADAPADTSVAVVNESGNGLVTLRDDAADAPAKLSFVFAPQTDTVTIAFRVRIDALGEHQVGKGDFGRMYIVAAGSDDWYANDTELFRIRNTAKGAQGSFSGLSYVLTDRYDEITMNADKVIGGYGDWVDVVYVVTPNNGTAKANTTDVYMNGYPVALAVANRNTVDYVNRLDVQTGTGDTLAFSLDDVKVYTGIVLPENTALTKPSALRIVQTPAVMAVQDWAQAGVEVSPALAHDSVTWSVVSGDAICVSDEGYVTAVKAGTAVLQAESVLDSAVRAQQTITVQDTVVRPETLSVPSLIHVSPGQSAQLQVNVLPADATEQGVKFELVSGGDVAAVDSEGVVTGKSVGSATIRVTSLSDPSVSGTVAVSVTETLTPGQLVFADSFDAGELDAAYWSTTLAKDNTFVEMEDGAMTLIDANSAANPKVNLTFAPVSGQVSIQFKVKVGGEVTIQGGSVKSTGYRNQRIAFGSGNIATTANESFCLRGNGTHFTYNTTGSTYVEIPGDYDVAEWNEVTLVTTIQVDGPDTTDVYINGVKALSGAANKVDYPSIDAVCFSADTSNFAVFSIDDLAIWAGGYDDKPNAAIAVARFGDVPADHWAVDAIRFACDNGLMAGIGSGSFAPDAATTRATLVTVLARLDGVDTSGGETWYSKAADWAVAQGVSDGTDPDGLISREQFVTMLYRYAGQPQAGGGTLAAFVDGAAVSDWAAPAVEWAVSAGLLMGRTDGTLDPAGPATRAEAAALLTRYCQWSENAQ